MNNKLRNFVLLAFVAFTLGSCVEGLLTEEPTNFVAPETFYKNINDAEIALAGAYNALQDGRTYNNLGVAVNWGWKGTDMTNMPPWEKTSRKVTHLYQITPTVPSVRDTWAGLYEGINQINSVVDRVAAMSDDLILAEDKNRILAEAKFCRAILYFGAVKIYENIPLLKNETLDLNDLNVSQASQEDVYAFIVEDLQFGIEHLEEGQGGGRATKGACQGLLGKVYLKMAGFPLNQSDKYALAMEQFDAVVQSGVYRLLPNYGDVFIYTNDNNDEIVFSVNFEGPGIGEGSGQGSYMGPNGSQENGGGWGTEYINTDFANSYEETDVRLAQNVCKFNVNDNNWPDNPDAIQPGGAAGWRPWKWHKPKPNNFLYDSPFDVQFLRYADVLLSYAEALNGANGGPDALAYSLLNAVTDRASASRWPEGLSQSEFVDVLVMERAKELCFEGHRKDDLVRMNRLKEVVMAVDQADLWSADGNPGDEFDDHEYIWPIPQAELDLNPNLVQNPGY